MLISFRLWITSDKKVLEKVMKTHGILLTGKNTKTGSEKPIIYLGFSLIYNLSRFFREENYIKISRVIW